MAALIQAGIFFNPMSVFIWPKYFFEDLGFEKLSGFFRHGGVLRKALKKASKGDFEAFSAEALCERSRILLRM